MPKCKTVYGCLTPNLCAKERKCIPPASAGATREPQAQSARSSVASGSAIPLPTTEEAAHGWRISRSFVVALCDEVNAKAPLGIAEETAELVIMALVRSGHVSLLPNTTMSHAHSKNPTAPSVGATTETAGPA